MSSFAIGDKKYKTGTRLACSDARNWENITVERWHHKNGVLGDVNPENTEIAVLRAGSLKVSRRGNGKLQESYATPGSAWICPAGVEEQDVQLFGDMEECLHIYIPPSAFRQTAHAEFDKDVNQIDINYIGGFQDKLTEQLILAIAREVEHESPAGDMLVDTLRLALTAHVINKYSSVASKIKALPKAHGSLCQKKLQRIDEFIDSHLHLKIALDELAKQACLSPFHFSRAFKVTKGVPPHKYLVQKRLSLAKRLIEQQKKSLVEIALSCGFSSQSHFCRSFKNNFGISPTDYRAQLIR